MESDKYTADEREPFFYYYYYYYSSPNVISPRRYILGVITEPRTQHSCIYIYTRV